MSLPARQGLYDPANEHDSCGVGFVVDIKGRKSHDLIRRGLAKRPEDRPALGPIPGSLVGQGAYPARPPSQRSSSQAPKSINLHRSEQKGRNGLPRHAASFLQTGHLIFLTGSFSLIGRYKKKVSRFVRDVHNASFRGTVSVSTLNSDPSISSRSLLNNPP